MSVLSDKTKIEWCDYTFNPWTGCTKVSPACANCYAESWAKRSGLVKWGKGQPRRRTAEANWRKPLKWNKEAEEAGDRPKVFCASLADWLDDEVPIGWLVDLLCLIRRTPHLDWLLLTKRPENWIERIGKARCSKEGFEESGLWLWLDEWLDGEPPANVWVGTTVESQEMAEARIPELVEIPARVRFLSCEPLLERLDLWGWICEPIVPLVDWVIVGGESGPGCREFRPEWARSIQAQCEAAEVPFFFKQMGGVRKPFAPIPDDLMVREFPQVEGGRHE
ncbi:MAG: phage Gp37/Gp68 family protein [Verrucomicrobiales bacterium]